MNRKTWEFPYPADKLLAAAQAKFDHHHGRQHWWQYKRDEVMAKIKEGGIEIDESVAAPFTGKSYRDPSVQLDVGLVRDMDECLAKVREHRDKATEYDGWVQVLGSQGQTMLPLHVDDWLFFFSKT